MRLQQRGRFPPVLQPHIDLLQQIRLVIGRLNHIRCNVRLLDIVGSHHLNRTVQRIVNRAALKDFPLHRRMLRPVRRGLVVRHQLPTTPQQIALKVIGDMGDDPRPIPLAEYLRSQVERLVIGLAFPILRLLKQNFVLELTPQHIGRQRTPQRVVLRAEGMLPTIPGTDGFARDIIQHPPCPRLHTGLVNAVAQQVIGVGHHDTVFGIHHLSLVALNIQHDPCGILDGFASLRVNPVVRYRQNRAPQGIQMGHRGRSGMDCRLLRRLLLQFSQGSILTLGIPGRRILLLR